MRKNTDQNNSEYVHYSLSVTAWKVPKYGVLLVHIFLYLDWMERFTRYSVRIQENKDQKNFSIWTLFTQCVENVETLSNSQETFQTLNNFFAGVVKF